MSHSEDSNGGDPEGITDSLVFFYIFELDGLLLAERFFPPTVVFEPLDLPPPRTTPREDIIVTEIRPRMSSVGSRPHGGRIMGQPNSGIAGTPRRHNKFDPFRQSAVGKLSSKSLFAAPGEPRHSLKPFERNEADHAPTCSTRDPRGLPHESDGRRARISK